ncbi:MAG TPA: hypothetical protein VFB97_01420 [Bacteroidales bacterium]|nr:hypothetical protein [Bacteroidales bacterium]
MEHLEIKRGPFTVIRTVIAILNIVAGAVAFVASLKSDNIIVKIAPIFIIFLGIYLLTNGFGLERCWFRTGQNSLIVKWINRIASVQIHDSRIFKISLERTRVMIYRKEDQPLKLDLTFLEKEQKTEIYNFLIDYAKKKNLVLEKHSSTLI